MSWEWVLTFKIIAYVKVIRNFMPEPTLRYWGRKIAFEKYIFGMFGN